MEVKIFDGGVSCVELCPHGARQSSPSAVYVFASSCRISKQRRWPVFDLYVFLSRTGVFWPHSHCRLLPFAVVFVIPDIQTTALDLCVFESASSDCNSHFPLLLHVHTTRMYSFSVAFSQILRFENLGDNADVPRIYLARKAP